MSNHAFEFRRSGEPTPKSFLERRIADVKRQFAERDKEKDAINSQYAKYRSQIQKSRKIDKDPQAAHALDGILGIHKTLAKRKLFAPTVPVGLSGIVVGRFTVKIAPPYDFAEWGGSGTSFANVSTGQISSSAVTDYKAGGSPFALALVDIHFRPLFGPATLRASISPSVDYQWWTNSIKHSRVRSQGAVSFGLSLSGSEGNFVQTELVSWDAAQSDDIQFDFGSNSQVPGSIQWDNVDPSLEYRLSVMVENLAYGQGWPGSLAGSMLSVTVPSITLELDALQVLH